MMVITHVAPMQAKIRLYPGFVTLLAGRCTNDGLRLTEPSTSQPEDEESVILESSVAYADPSLLCKCKKGTRRVGKIYKRVGTSVFPEP